MVARYKYLLTYRYAEMICDANVEFCVRCVDRKSRTYDQMIQAGRSGKQNIVEAVGESDTTKKNEIKLLGIAKGSFEELLADYEDYLRQRKLLIYPKASREVAEFRQLGYRLSALSNLSSLGDLREKLELPGSQVDAANLLMTLLHIETYLLDKQIKAMIEKFQKDGGFSEQLLRGRLSRRV
jgi:four helix bundle suffix protein